MPPPALDPAVLQLLRCPVCHGTLQLAVATPSILCLGCGRLYPIRDGIPVLIASEAKP